MITLAFCRAPPQEGNLYARTFMEAFGVPLGLTVFVVLANLPIYMTLSFDSHVVRFPFRLGVIIEIIVDLIFGWFIAGLHFSGGTSWFWDVPEWNRQVLGACLYIVAAFLLIKQHIANQRVMSSIRA
ncbi:MAG: hypothetical protein PVF96_05000 [Candidatus Bathyarchaeota archaeon]